MFRLKYLFLLLPLFLVSCVDEDSMLGLGLVDQADLLNVKKYDKFDINAFLFHEGDSLKTSDYRYMTLGSYKDNEFGKVTTSIYTQISLSSTSIDFNYYKNKADSIVLTMAYTGLFSRDTSIKSMNMNISVYEIIESFADSAAYYSNSTLQHNSTPIISKTIRIAPKESVILGTDTLTAQLRLNLGNDFLEKLKNAGEFTSNEDFLNYFKGLYIKLTTTDENGMVAYFDMYSSNSGMMLYYQDGNDKTQKYNFVFDQASRRFTHVDYDFSSSQISQFSSKRKSSKDSIDCNALASKMYIGTLGISMAKLNINDLIQWYKDSAQNLGMFNQAMLILPVDDDYIASVGVNNIPSRIICYRKDSDGNLVYIHDAYTSELYMGTYDTTSKSYKMRITSHLQNYLNGNISSSEIYLIPDSKTSTANRVVLNGPKHATKPAKIEIIYTR